MTIQTGNIPTDSGGSVAPRQGLSSELSHYREPSVNERFEMLLGALDGLMWMLDLSTAKIVSTQTGSPFLGFSEREMSDPNQWWVDHVHPDDLGLAREELRRGLEAGRSRFERRYRFRRADGEYAMIADQVHVQTHQGLARRVMGIMRDAQEAVLTREALAASEARYRALIAASVAGVWQARPDGTFVVNPHGLGRGDFVYDNEKIERGDFSDMVPPEDYAWVKARWDHCLKTGEMYVVEHKMPLRGEWKWHQVRGVPVRDAMGRITEWIGAFLNIEDRKRMENQLRERAALAVEQQNWLVSVMESMPIAKVLVEVGNGRVLYANSAARKMMQVIAGTGDWEQGRTLIRCMDLRGNPLGSDACPLMKANHGKSVSNMEFVLSGPRGRMDVVADSEKIPAAFGQPESMSICLRDVTRVRAVESELRSANEAKDRFLAVLSHELRTPLTPVLSMAQMLEGDANLGAEARESIAMIRRNIELETRLIDDLLDQTRLSRGKLKIEKRVVDLSMVIRNVIAICDPDMRGRALELDLELPGEPLTVLGDAARLSQAFWNLLKNSVKFTPEKGRIILSVTRVSNSMGDEAPHVVVRIKDSGIGIPAHMLPRVFDAFMQGEHDVRRYGGLGLGLTISKALIELHGGELAVRSEGHNQGAEFTVRLRLHDSPEPAGIQKPAPAEGQPRIGLKVLVVEDHGDSARMLAKLLKRFGHDATIAGNVATAIANLRSGRFDLLISDIGLPDGSGYDIMRQTADVRPRAIAVSGFGMDEDLARSREAGFEEHLTKPIDITVLENAIRRVCGV